MSASAFGSGGKGPEGDRQDVTLPPVGAGTAVFYDIGPAQKNRSAEHASTIVRAALSAPVQPVLIDTAAMYCNEKEIGAVLAEDGVARDDVFVVTKIGHFNVEGDPPHTACDYVEDPSVDAYEGATAELKRNLEALGLAYVDLALVHWPGAPRNANPPEVARAKRAAVWRALEDCRDAGLCKAIGVSNFTKDHLVALRATQRVAPAVNQIEIHPYLPQEDLVRFCQDELGMAVMAYCPLASSEFGLLADAVVAGVAESKGATPGAVVLQWHRQRGIVPVPKSTNPARVVANLTPNAFVLRDEDMARITALGDTPRRVCPDPHDFV